MTHFESAGNENAWPDGESKATAANLRPSDSDVMLTSLRGLSHVLRRTSFATENMPYFLGILQLTEKVRKRGTDLAPFGRGSSIGGPWCRALAWLVCLGSVGGCVVTPEVANIPEETPVVSILDDKIDPRAFEVVSVAKEQAVFEFSVLQATDVRNVKSSLNYNWFYDYDSSTNVPLPYYSLCGNSPRCFLSVCTRPDITKDNHRLLLVVSDTKLKEDAETPIDFPEGAIFDTVHWQLELSGNCPNEQ